MTKLYVSLVPAALVSLISPNAAIAAPGLDEVVYGATVERGVNEIESRYGRLSGKSADGADAVVLEASHGFSTRFYGAALAIFTRNPGESRKLEAVALEGIAPLGRIKPLGIDTAVYIELEKPIHEAAKFESKLLLEKRSGGFDSRLNLIGEKSLGESSPVELRYAASSDIEIAKGFRLGAEAFGELGTTRNLTTRGEHYLGPSLSTEFDAGRGRKIELRAGYLLALGRAKDETNGQFRLGLALEFGDHDED